MSGGGARRFGEQFAALYVKNALVAWRNRRATVLRLLAPLFFLLLALLIDKALQANQDNQAVFSQLDSPEPEAITPIPRCSEDLYIGDKPCIELLFTPDNPITQMIMGNVTSRNAKPITARPFPTRQDANVFLLDNPDYALGAVHFVFGNTATPGVLGPLEGFIVQVNTTYKTWKGDEQDFNKFLQLPLQLAVQREIARYNLNQNPATQSWASTLSWEVFLSVFPHPTLASTSVISRVLGPFVFAACMFSFVTQLSTVVMEKELGLRTAMRTMGMMDSSYWVSWMMWECTLAFFTGHIISILGLIMQFDLFKKNNYGILFFLFFLFQLAMSSLGLACSTLIRRTQTAVYLGFLIFIIGWIMQTVVIFGVPYAPEYFMSSGPSAALTIIFSAFPWNLLMKGFADLGSATVGSSTPGIAWNERKAYCQNIESIDDQNAWAQKNNYNTRDQYVNFNCVLPLNTIYWAFVALWLGYLVLAIYLDNVLRNEFGVRRPVFYFLYPSYWRPSTLHPVDALSHVLKEDGRGPDVKSNADEDVLAEESRMKQLLQHRTGHTSKEGELAAAVDVRNAVEVYGLKKKYGGSNGCCGRSLVCCGACDGCSCKAAPSFWPIKGSWFAIEENQLFCLLGPNGAGKTTTINCLIGQLPPTYGDALIYGQSIRSTGGVDKIRSIMGVCPQFDVLWPELTGHEHLMIYGRIKGIGWKNVPKEAEDLLEKVKLTYAGTQRSSAYSGGMKRRLSVAIALLGDPKVVYLDEPTTGMDPISRRYVWDIIQQAKVGRAIVLTTHSMEEADILGDRIAIMALGRLRCIGSSLRLKQRFGSGYQVSISVQPGTGQQVDPAIIAQRSVNVKKLFEDHMGLKPFDEGKVYTTFLVPREREADLIPFLASLEKNSDNLGITDIQLSLTSLEEVFLSVAKKAALEAAQETGQTTRRKKDLQFCSTCLKATLLAVTLPISIFGVYWWSRFLVGKEKDQGPVATLPDNTTVPVSPGQEYVQDEQGNNYKVIWGVDDQGHLVVQETKAVDAAEVAAANTTTAAAASGNRTYYPAVNGKARVPMPGNVLMEVAVGNTYVMNPVDNSTYVVTWGKDSMGNDVVLSCDPAGLPPPAQTMSGSLGARAPLPPVAAPINGSGHYGPNGSLNGRNSGALNVAAPRPLGEGMNPEITVNPAYQLYNQGSATLPHSIPSPRGNNGAGPSYRPY